MFLDSINTLGQSILSDSVWSSYSSHPIGAYSGGGDFKDILPWPVHSNGQAPSLPASNNSKLSISTNLMSQGSSNFATSVATYQSGDSAVLADLVDFSVDKSGRSVIGSDLFRAFQFSGLNVTGPDQRVSVNDTVEALSCDSLTCVFNAASLANSTYGEVVASSPAEGFQFSGNSSLVCVSPDSFAVASYNSSYDISAYNFTLRNIKGFYQGVRTVQCLDP